MSDFFEEDEPVAEVVTAFEQGEHFETSPAAPTTASHGWQRRRSEPAGTDEQRPSPDPSTKPSPGSLG